MPRPSCQPCRSLIQVIEVAEALVLLVLCSLVGTCECRHLPITHPSEPPPPSILRTELPWDEADRTGGPIKEVDQSQYDPLSESHGVFVLSRNTGDQEFEPVVPPGLEKAVNKDVFGGDDFRPTTDPTVRPSANLDREANEVVRNMDEGAIVLHEFFPEEEEAKDGLTRFSNQSALLKASDKSFDGNYEALLGSTGNETDDEPEAAARPDDQDEEEPVQWFGTKTVYEEVTELDGNGGQHEDLSSAGDDDEAAHDFDIHELVSSYVNGTIESTASKVVEMPSLEDTMTDDSMNFDSLMQDAAQTDETVVEPLLKDQEDPFAVGVPAGPPVAGGGPAGTDEPVEAPVDHEEEELFGQYAETAMESTLIDEGLFGSPGKSNERGLDGIDSNTGMGLYDANDHHMSDLRHLMTTPN